jgi:RNAse (barnase) inhibitor barstar
MFEPRVGMDRYVIDFTDIQNYFDIHRIIAEALDFPEWYGCNWDAFWDLITDMIGEPLHIEILGLGNLKRIHEPEVDIMMNILKRFKHYANDKYVQMIKIEIVDDNGVKTEIM